MQRPYRNGDLADARRREQEHQDSLITPDTFLASDFNVATLVQSLMELDVKRAKSEGGTFDPRPHIQTLEHALALLLPLRKENAARTVELERSVASAERAYRGDIRGAKAGFETVNTQFQALDMNIAKVGRTAVRIEESLESIDRLRQRASEAHDLILYYNEFAMGDTSRLESMRKDGGRDGRAKVAIAARRLMSLSKEVEGVEGADLTRDTIEKYCERFEKDMLRLFDRYYRKGDPKAMAHCAQTLQDFNGGQSCIQIYVNQHDFFISKDRVQDAAGALVGGKIWESLPDPEVAAPTVEPGLSSLFDEIRLTVGQEAQIITAVFPQPAVVMQVFLQRVFAQVIQGYIESLITTASSSSTLAYLRIVHLSHSSAISLVSDLKSHAFFRTSSSSNTSSTAVPTAPKIGAGIGSSTLSLTSSGGGAGAGGVGAGAVSAMLESAMEELFVPYMEGTRYLDKEGKSLTELYAGKLMRFTNWHRATNKAKAGNTIFDRMVSQLTTAAHQAALATKDAIPDSSSSSSPHLASSALLSTGESSRLGQLMKLSGISSLSKERLMGAGGIGGGSSSSNQGGSKNDELPILPDNLWQEGDGELDLGVAEKMLKWHAEAIGRMVELSSSGDVPKNAFFLLKVLADSFGKAYVETALDTNFHLLSIYDSKSEPSLPLLRVVRWTDMILHLWQRYLATALIPLAATSVTVRREMSVFNHHILVRIEGKVNAIVQSATDAILSWLTHLLSKQKKLDFKPRNDDLAYARSNTEPCQLACAFLDKVRLEAGESLSGKNREAFLLEIGVAFHTLLLDHLKRLTISAAGGLMLTKDLSLYRDTFSLFSLSPLNERYEFLRQLGALYLVPASSVANYLRESEMLGKIANGAAGAGAGGAGGLRAFVAQRADYGDYTKRWWDELLDGSMATAGDQNGAGGGGEEKGRRGAMGLGNLGGLMRDLSLRIGDREPRSSSVVHTNTAVGGGSGETS